MLTARQNRSSEANFKYSIKKHFTDVLRPLGIPVVFDRRLQTPPNKNSDTWVSITMENSDLGTNVFERNLQVACCSVKDIEFMKLSSVVDAVTNLLIVESPTDTVARIPLLTVGEKEVSAAIGHMVVTEVYMYGEYDLENQTKVRPFRVKVWYAV